MNPLISVVLDIHVDTCNCVLDVHVSTCSDVLDVHVDTCSDAAHMAPQFQYSLFSQNRLLNHTFQKYAYLLVYSFLLCWLIYSAFIFFLLECEYKRMAYQ